MKGTVIKSTGSWYEVRTPDGQTLSCRLKGIFKLEESKITNPIAVGDKVEISREEKGEHTWIIRKIFPRENYIIRKAIKKAEHSHLLAANIDQVVVMATVTLPRTSLGFIDRVLVTAEAYRIPAMVIWNKSDILKEKDRRKVNFFMEQYKKTGYPIRLISAQDPKDVKAMRSVFQDKVNLLVGHSGVGKSTLMNQLIPGLNQKTAEVSTFANKGVHTTTFAEMFVMDNQSFIIDTPGIKELGLSEIYDEELSHYFPEMRALFGECKFHNCTHIHEPQCAVIELVEMGEIPESRYLSYLSMFKEEDNRR